MHKLIRPNLIRRTNRPAASNESFVSSNNIQLFNSGPQSPVNMAENADAPFPVNACICTLLKNDEENFSSIITNIRSLQKYFSKSFVVFVESNSTDNTVEVFSKVDNALFIHLDSASESAQRNAYLSFVVKNTRMFDVMIVLDTKIAIRKPINKSSFGCLSSANYSQWDAVFANQSYKYYDIDSLRTKETLSNPEKSKSMKQHIPRDEKYIPVISAFGGLALYKTHQLDKCEYKSDGHVSFNILYNRQCPRMFIDPSLVLETLEENAHLYL
jgi:hypothetical protein